MGNPGGLFHMCDGAVTAVDTPGSPGAEALLLCSGRISEQDWTAALREGAGTRPPQTELVTLGIIGSTELQVVALTAIQDGAFAVASGEIEGYVVDDEDKPTDVLLPAPNRVTPDVLMTETARRLDALASLPFPVSPFQERVVPARGTELPILPGRRQEIIAHATGRRTARDIAFVIGRSVYPITAEISRMLSDGSLELAPPRPLVTAFRWSATSLRPRREPAPPIESDDDQVDQLPARLPGPSATTDSPDNQRAPGHRALSRLSRIFGTERKHIGP
ncbi:hypothetical protein JOF56_008667 [Kibdelosporangium banguiense]|uniref:Uncharacterized protein n=1 Tax=Kibdelosporangium banguiense TaxID=1365924 RepID=A0ABS4TV39_9PSEU|nr:hypothetical protein [Kibdelosporangium banguiense]MBP2328282.1 hypothetical protein [Kibdelosporangium banguiense]